MLFMKKRKNKESKKSKKSNKKKISNISIISIILIISIGIFILFNVFNADNEKCERIENGYCIYEGVPKYLKFQEPVKSELWNYSKTPAIDYFILKNPNNYSEGHLCTDTYESPEFVWYFRKICNEGYYNCYHSRRATLCGTFYLVQEFKIGDNILGGDVDYYEGYGNVTKISYGPYEL